MSIAELTQRATIEFPRAISKSQAKELFREMAKKGYNVISEIKTQQRYNSDNLNPKERMISALAKIGGGKYSLSDVITLLTDNETGFTGMHFTRVPGRDRLAEYGNNVKLWDDVRKITQNYFDKQTEKTRAYKYSTVD